MKTSKTDVVCFLIAVILLASLAMGYAQLAYGDWTCAFATCRKLIE